MKLRMADDAARTPLHQCPECGHKIDAASAINEPGIYATPEAGDHSVCFYCMAWLTYRDDLSMRRITEKEINNLETDEREALIQATRAIAAYRETGRSKVR